MGEVIHGVNNPLVARAEMRNFLDPIQRGVPHVDVARSHVDLGPQHPGAFFELSVTHALKQVKIVGDSTRAIRAILAGFGESAAVFANLVWRQVINVGLARLYEMDCALEDLFEVVGCVKEPVVPVESEPPDVPNDVLFEFFFFLARIGIVETEIAHPPAVFGGYSEIQAKCFRMTDVEISVWLGRKTRVNAAVVLVGLQIFGNSSTNEIQRSRGFHIGYFHK